MPERCSSVTPRLIKDGEMLSTFLANRADLALPQNIIEIISAEGLIYDRDMSP